jgi:hypothetical protein
VKPLIYGYLRAADDLDDDEIRQRELDLEKLADAKGLCLATIYYEYVPSRQDVVNDLRSNVGLRVAESVTGLFEDSLSHDEQTPSGTNW